MIEQWLQTYQTNGIDLSLQELLQYKNRHQTFDLSPRHNIKAQLAGGYLARSKGRGMEFDEARHYQAGDDIRAIDWRVTARTGKTHTKIYREEKERPVFVVTDLSSTMHFGTQFVFKSIQAAHLTAAIAWAAKARGDRVGGIVFTDDKHLEFKPVNRQKGVLTMLNGLMKLHGTKSIESNGMLVESLARLRRLAHPGSLIYVVSDFVQLSEMAEKHIKKLSQHCEIVAYHIFDPFEASLPETSITQSLPITDGTNEQHVTLGDKKQQRHYQEQQRRHVNTLTERLKRSQCQVISINAGEPLLSQFEGKV